MKPQQLISPFALLRTAFSLYKKNWKKLGSILLIPVICFAIVSAFVLLTGFSHDSAIVLAGGLIGLLLDIGVFAVGIAAYIALVHAIHRLSTESAPVVMVKDELRYGFSLLWPFILVVIISGLVVYGSMALLIIPGIAIAIYTGFNAFAFIIDGKRGFSALTESYALVRGRWWATFGRGLFLAILVIIALFILETIGVLAISFAGIAGYVVAGLAIILGEIVLISFALIYSYQLYAALKSTRSAEVVVSSALKPWLVVFMVLGIFVCVGYLFMIAMSGLSYAADSRMRTMPNTPYALEIATSTVQSVPQQR
jgi:hypothetical protein